MERPHASPLWIPAFAGMTKVVGIPWFPVCDGMTKELR